MLTASTLVSWCELALIEFLDRVISLMCLWILRSAFGMAEALAEKLGVSSGWSLVDWRLSSVNRMSEVIIKQSKIRRIVQLRSNSRSVALRYFPSSNFFSLSFGYCVFTKFCNIFVCECETQNDQEKRGNWNKVDSFFWNKLTTYSSHDVFYVCIFCNSFATFRPLLHSFLELWYPFVSLCDALA